MHNDFRIGLFTIRPSRNAIEGVDGEQRLSHKAMLVLLCLAERPGDVLSKNALIEHAWDGAVTSDEALSTVIYELRRAFGDRARDPSYIETIRKGGYRLIAPLSEIDPAADSAPPLPDPISPAATPFETNPPIQEIDSASSAAGQQRSIRPARTWVVVALLIGVFGGWLTSKSIQVAEDSEIRSLAVLPMVSGSETRELDFFAQGLTAMLTADLASVGSLDILSGLTTVDSDSAWPVPAASELEADAFLEGLVQRSGDRLWLSVKLVDSLTGQVLWGGTYERRGGDELVLQRELALEIGQQIRRRLESAP